MAESTPLPMLLLHAARALSTYAEHARRDGVAAPVELVEWAAIAVEAARAVQSGPTFDRLLSGVDGGGVSPLLLSLPAAAELLGVSVSTVKRLVAAGELPVVVVGGTRKVRRADVEAYVETLAGGRVETKAGPLSRLDPAAAASAAAAGSAASTAGLPGPVPIERGERPWTR